MTPDATAGDAASSWLVAADRRSPWPQVTACVVGALGVSGFAAADALQHLGARVVALDDAESERASDRAALLAALEVEVRSGPGATAMLPPGVDLVVTASGLPPGNPAVVAAERRGVPVWGEAELAWRLHGPERPPWLCVTGTNGKTTTVAMLAAMLRAAGLRATAAGNVGLPLCEVVLDPEPYDVLAVELSSYQLASMSALSAEAAAVLNVHPDHLDWHGSFEAYAAAKARIYQHCVTACVYNVEEPLTREMVEQAEVVEGCRAVGFTRGVPAPGMLGVVDGALADRAFTAERRSAALELARVDDVASQAPHNVANALAAAALARAFDVPPRAVRDGLRGSRLDPHRIQTVATVAGVRYVDDSKATNPAAARASLTAFRPVVWLAGGLAKGADFDDLVTAVGDRLRGVVLFGADRALVAAALARHAPQVHVVEVGGTETEVMQRVVAAAAAVALPGDTVLLAPGCASQDIFTDYAARGDAFAAAVAELPNR